MSLPTTGIAARETIVAAARANPRVSGVKPPRSYPSTGVRPCSPPKRAKNAAKDATARATTVEANAADLGREIPA
jgi:hypothetical protein